MAVGSARGSRVVCISPHPDDAALSCGGVLAMQRERGQSAHVVTVFAGAAPPAEGLTPLARRLHHAWGDWPDPVAHRRREDARALGILGSSATWWDYRDAIYRHPAYDSDERLFGAPADEAPLEGELCVRCAELPGQVLLFPLAVGHHVDHRILFRVGWKLWATGRPVAFYEDQPYVARSSGPQQRLAEIGQPLYPQTIDVTAWWPTKVAAVSRYTSQLAELTRDGESALEALGRYASSFQAGAFVERLWWPGEGLWI